ncbi:kinase-like domain-containing protein, partial [Mycena galericulata]
MHQRSSSRPQSPSPFAYGVSLLQSASDVPPPLPTPPSSAQSSLDRNLPCANLPTPLFPRPLGMHQRSSSRPQSPSPFAYNVSPLPSSGVLPALPTPPSSAQSSLYRNISCSRNCEPGSPEITSRDDDDEKNSSGEETTFDETSLVGFHSRDLSGRVEQDDKYPFAGGGNSNIYRGKLTRSDGSKIRVAIKLIRMSDDGSGQQHEEMLRRLNREVDIWRRLKHRNILTFIGVCENLAPWPVLISPFYKFGHVEQYLTNHPGVNRKKLVLGVASGLQFLHENGVVHGDLKVQNVLVDKHGIPCICDFGISKVVSCRGFTTSNVGTAPYMAPELFCVVDGPGMNSHASSTPGTTPSSDVYSFALLVLEILTAEPPKGRPSRPIVTARILADLRPKRTDYDKREVSRRTWSVLDRCWSFEPLLRPSISEVLRDLTECFVPTRLLHVEGEELVDRLVV